MSHSQTNPGVVVTGMGVLSPAGATLELFWQKLCAGESTIGWLPSHGHPAGARLAGCAVSSVTMTASQRIATRKMDRCVHLAMVAANAAWHDAALAPGETPTTRVGVIAGTSRGPLGRMTESVQRLAKGRMLPTLAANTTIACLSGALAGAFRMQGPCYTVSAACASSAVAVAQGAVQILSGAADVMLVGGAEASLNPMVLAQLQAAGVLGHNARPELACRPFDRDRNGTALGEGAAFLVLESAAHAKQRGARVHARLAGWAMGAESGTRTGIAESGEGLYQVMQQALQVAGIEPSQVGYLNAHGTGTRLNDRLEAKSIRRFFGAGTVACSSTKAVTGHCMGAAAAIEAVASILALQHGVAPPSVNCAHPDAACELDLVLGQARPLPGLRVAVSNSAGFWGHNAALVFARV